MNVVLRLTEAAVEFLWVVGWGGVGFAKSFSCHVQPNHCAEVVLRCVVVGVVTIIPNSYFTSSGTPDFIQVVRTPTSS